MSRPSKRRCVASLPGVTYFKPAGVPLRLLEEVRLSVEEAEALRLKEIEGLEQRQGATRMNVSRPTFQRILASARQKVANALLSGKAIRIEGGNYELFTRDAMSGSQEETGRQQGNESVQNIAYGGARSLMKIAAVSEDGTTVSQHFGRATHYVVYTVEEGRVVKKEKREKSTHHVAGQEHSAVAGERHGFDAAAQSTHAGMMSNIADCQVVMAGGMGWGARESLKAAGIETVMTDILNIDEAVKLYVAGTLPNRTERLH